MAGIDDLSKLVIKELLEYSDEVEEIMCDEIEKCAMDVKSDLSNNVNTPVDTGKYKKSFYIKVEGKGKGFIRYRVANKKYQLTHLLEYGHAKVNGGRTRAYPHWINGQEIADELPERIKRRLGK